MERASTQYRQKDTNLALVVCWPGDMPEAVVAHWSCIGHLFQDAVSCILYVVPGALAQALLPPPYTEADVTPRERAFADAASVARLSAVLLSLLQTSDTEDAQPPDNQQQKMQHSSSSSSHNYYVRLQQAHGPWLSKPRTLGPPNPGIRERFHIVRDEIRQAAVKASQATDGSGGSWLSMRSRDPVAYVVQYLV